MITYAVGGMAVACCVLAALWQWEVARHDATRARLASTEIAHNMAEASLTRLESLSSRRTDEIEQREQDLADSRKHIAALTLQIDRQRATIAARAIEKPFALGNRERADLARLLCHGTACAPGVPAGAAGTGDAARPAGTDG